MKNAKFTTRAAVSVAFLLTGGVFAQSVTLSNDSLYRSYPGFVLGDPWTLTVNGAPNMPVSIQAYHNEEDLGTTPLGYTNGSGFFQIGGEMESWTVGDWVETVYVNGVAASPVLEFEVEEPETCSFSPPGNQSQLTMYSWDVYPDSQTTLPNIQTSWQPQIATHEVTGGPCRFHSVATAVYYAKAEWEEDDWDVGVYGYKEVKWTLQDWALTDPSGQIGTSGPRCNFTIGGCNPSYTIYDYGNVQTVFEHVDTLATYWVTSYYTFVIYGCLRSTTFCL